MSKTEIVHFTVTGEFITETARRLWNDEDEPEKALNILKCMQGISDAQCLDILAGRSKLIGDSTKGVELVPDDQKLKGLKEVLGKMKRERDDAKDESADLVQMAIDDTVPLASHKGLVKVPRRKTEVGGFMGRRVLKKGFKLGEDDPGAEPNDKSIVHKEVQIDLEGPRKKVGTLRDKPKVEEPPAAPKPKWKPEPETKISGRNGWVSPKGEFFGCAYFQHNWLADKLDESYHILPKDMFHLDLMELGWLKVQSPHDKEQHFFYGYDKVKIGSETHSIWKKMVQEFCAAHNEKVPFHFSDQEDDDE